MSEGVKVKAGVQTVKRATSERVFKMINIVLLSLLVLCIKGFWQFRQISIQEGIYVFSLQSLWWCFAGFVGRYIVKYSYFKLAHGAMNYALSKKEESEEDREYRLKSIKKLTFDFLFYTGITVWAYYLFRKEYWFPQVAGGEGECKAIYRQYPNWPSNPETSSNMQVYFMVQMGIHLFSLFELCLITGKSYRKFHEFLLHHCVTIILILFSMMTNQIAAGIVIIVIHDFSDIFSALGRAYLETRFLKTIPMAIGLALFLGSWIYMRAIVYPFCILSQVWTHAPQPTDIWYMINFEYKLLLAIAVVLVGMHIFWIYLLFEFGYKKIVDSKKKKNQEKGEMTKKDM